jgi:protein involved in polysaccharide export with SLBB domain
MPSVRAVMPCPLAALALPDGMQTTAPVAVVRLLRSESAIAIAGGFSPRARRDHVTLTHSDSSGSTRIIVPLGTSLSPGDTILVAERWF